MTVCTIGDTACGSARLLLRYGANPNGHPKVSALWKKKLIMHTNLQQIIVQAHSTPLIIACEGCHNLSPLVQLLIENGADINKADRVH